MGTESQGLTDDIAFWRRCIFAWMLIIALESLHGAAREIFIAPVLGDLRARQLGVVVGSVIVFLVAWLTARWLAAHTRRLQLTAGLLWVALTVTFEITLGRAIGASWQRILEDYNPLRGGFMGFGLAFMAFAPMLAAHLRAPSRNTP
jgi:hypothetical protein